MMQRKWLAEIFKFRDILKVSHRASLEKLESVASLISAHSFTPWNYFQSIIPIKLNSSLSMPTIQKCLVHLEIQSKLSFLPLSTFTDRLIKEEDSSNDIQRLQTGNNSECLCIEGRRHKHDNKLQKAEFELGFKGWQRWIARARKYISRLRRGD